MNTHQLYTCPMHPEVVSETPGNCPKCGMKLVIKDEKNPVVHTAAGDKGLGTITWKSYIPLIAIIKIIVLTAVVFSIRDLNLGVFAIEKAISYFMIGFFLTFATFKLMDLKGFAEGYQTYDLLAQKVPAYGYIYPFIELGFAFAMILLPFSFSLLVIECVVMAFSGLGVTIKLAKKEPIICACLGTFLKIPLTKVTLVEDFGMAVLALIMIVLASN